MTQRNTFIIHLAMESIVGCQLSVVSCQLSFVICHLSIVISPRPGVSVSPCLPCPPAPGRRAESRRYPLVPQEIKSSIAAPTTR